MTGFLAWKQGALWRQALFFLLERGFAGLCSYVFCDGQTHYPLLEAVSITMDSSSSRLDILHVR